LLHRNIDVLDAEPDGLHNPQAAPVEQFRHQLRGPLHEREDRGNLFTGHHDGDVDFLVGAHGVNAAIQRLLEDALIEKDQGIHGLVLGRRRHVALDGQVGQKRLDLGFSGHEVGTRPHGVKTDEADDPLHVGPLRVNGVMVEPEDPPDVIDEGRWWTVLCVSHKKNAVLAPWNR